MNPPKAEKSEPEMDPEEVAELKERAELKVKAKTFVESYYRDLDVLVNRSELHSRFREESHLTYNGKHYNGTRDICKLLTELPIAGHEIISFDCQVSYPRGSVIILVHGMLVVPADVHPKKFSQMFLLKSAQNGDFYVSNSGFQVI